MEIFGTENHKIIHGDVLKALRTEVLDNSVDLIFADPPYNIGKFLMDKLKNGKQKNCIWNGAINGLNYV